MVSCVVSFLFCCFYLSDLHGFVFVHFYKCASYIFLLCFRLFGLEQFFVFVFKIAGSIVPCQYFFVFVFKITGSIVPCQYPGEYMGIYIG